MELMSGVCTFCKKSDEILKTTDNSCLYLNLASKTVFGDDEKVLSQFQNRWRSIKLCVLCTHKIQVVHDFVENYKKNATKLPFIKKRTKVCFLCERPSSIVATNSKSCGFSDEFNEFTRVLAVARDNKDHYVCIYCVFALNSWHNLRSAIFEILKQTDGLPLTDGNETWGTSKGALKLTFSYCGDGKMRVRRKDLTSPKLQKYLKECLKNHIPLKKNKKLKLNYNTDDAKILDKIPYVLIDRRNLMHERKKPAVLPIKIKMSPKFLTAKPEKVTHKKTPTRVSKSPKKTPTMPKLKKKIIYKCNTCDVIFKRNYLYQEHNLNHVKPDRLVVKITRSEFSNVNNPSSTNEETVESNDVKESQEIVEEEKCDDIIENSKSADELNSSDEKSLFNEENEVSSSTEMENCAPQDNKVDSTNNDELEQKETPTAIYVCKQNGDSNNVDNLQKTETIADEISFVDEESEEDTNSSVITDDANTRLTDEERGNLKRKFDELNETTDSNEDSPLKYPPRKKVRFACDLDSRSVDELCTSDKEDLTETEFVDATNECE